MKLSVSGIKHSFKGLCGPSQFYLLFSLLSLALYLLQMMGTKNRMNTAIGFSMQTLVTLAWTFILNWVCSLKYGNKIAWFLVFLPLLLLFTILIVFYHMIDTMGLSKGDIHAMIKQTNVGGYTYDDGDLIECDSCDEHSI